jgi:hypothetical protein
MNRAQATEAAQRGERVERFNASTGEAQQLKWHDDNGLTVFDGDWYIERGICDRFASQWRSFEYREAFTPRTFLGRWREVRTFAEAEPAGETMSGELRLAVQESASGHGQFLNSVVNGSHVSYWVARITDDAGERDSAQPPDVAWDIRGKEPTLVERFDDEEEWVAYSDWENKAQRVELLMATVEAQKLENERQYKTICELREREKELEAKTVNLETKNWANETRVKALEVLAERLREKLSNALGDAYKRCT